MKIEEGKFYFLKDDFFEKMKDNNLSNNKDNGNKRKSKPYIRNSTKREESSVSRYYKDEKYIVGGTGIVPDKLFTNSTR